MAGKPRAIAGVVPFRVQAPEAAWLVGEPTVDAFLLRVQNGTYPAGRKVGRYMLWRTSELQKAVDPEAPDKVPSPSNDSFWLEKFGRAGNQD